MARYMTTVGAIVFLSISNTVLADSIPQCGPGNLCPASAPCCSQYGQCGIGAYCLGGCDPLFSNTLTSCVPAPICSSSDYKLTSLSNTAPINQYLGDASSANWVYSGQPAAYEDNSILLTMAEDTVGTLMASTSYVWYGKISTTLQTSQGAGVVTAFIMMSDVKDEIDFEFVGADTGHAQSNFYSQGVTNYNNGGNLSISDTAAGYHTYTIDWQPDSITWSIDGTVMRTLDRATTWNSTANRFDYPQTPARVMLSLWPAGLATNAPGTIAWAGGLVDWNSPYMQNGYYYARVSEVSVQCYDPPSGANVQGSKSYIYTNTAGTNNTVEITNNVVVLASLEATGDNPKVDPDASSSSGKGSSTTASGAAAVTSSQPETVPGMVGAGEMGDDSTSVASESTGAQQTGSVGSSSSNNGSGGSGFSQGGTDAGSSAATKAVENGVVRGSMFAVIVAVGVLVL